MIVLALDTATPPGSCAVVRDGVVLRERAADAALSHAARLPRDLMRILDETGQTLAEVDAFAVASGPGSFTGVRVGIATMQGLAFAAGRPLFGVSALDALAMAAGAAAAGDRRPQPHAHGRLAAWIGAWRGEVYAALYAGSAVLGTPGLDTPGLDAPGLDAPAIEGPAVGSPADLLAGYPEDELLRFAGDGALAHWEEIRARRGNRATLVSPPAPALAATIAIIAAARAAAGQRPPPGEVRQLYVRRPDTESTSHVRPV